MTTVCFIFCISMISVEFNLAQMILAGIELQVKFVVFFFPNVKLKFNYLLYHFDRVKNMALISHLRYKYEFTITFVNNVLCKLSIC